MESAKVLLSEKDFDGSASRAYYAMFYATEALLLTKGLKFNSHKGVISMFGRHFVQPGIFKPEMGKILSKAFDERLIGDYSFEPQIDSATAQDLTSKASTFICEIKRYISQKS